MTKALKPWDTKETNLFELAVKNPKVSLANLTKRFGSEKRCYTKAWKLGLHQLLQEKRVAARPITARKSTPTSTKQALTEGLAKVLEKIKTGKGLAAVPAIKKPHLEKGSGDEEEAVLVISDLHVGRRTDTFNATVAKERVATIVKSVAIIAALHRNAHPLRKITVFLLGDIVNSEDVGKKVNLSEVDSLLHDQIYGPNSASDILTWAFRSLLENFETVVVKCVRGNHGAPQKHTGMDPLSNWDTVTYHTIEAAFIHEPRIKFEIATKFYQIADIMGKKFLLVHGDQMRGGGSHGVPLYGLTQRMMKWSDSMEEHWDVMVCGHWHHCAAIDQNTKELFVNGTAVTDDEYIKANYGNMASCAWWYFHVHPRKGITARYKLHMDFDKKYYTYPSAISAMVAAPQEVGVSARKKQHKRKK